MVLLLREGKDRGGEGREGKGREKEGRKGREEGCVMAFGGMDAPVSLSQLTTTEVHHILSFLNTASCN